jgi:hypothetical protein
MTNGKSKQDGLVIGVLIGGWHLVWTALVAAGWAQSLISFIFWAHMIRPSMSSSRSMP